MPLFPILAAGAGAAGLGQAAVDLFGKRRTEYDAFLERELERLQRDRQAGFGLSNEERAARESQYIDPVRGMASRQRSHDDAVAAATGQTSGAALDAARRRSADAIGQAIQQGRAAIAQEHGAVARQEAQQNRQDTSNVQTAMEQRRADRRSQTAESVGQALNSTAMLAGAVPGLMEMAGVGGTAAVRPPTATESYLARMVRDGKLTEAEAATLQADPGRLMEFIQAGRRPAAPTPTRTLPDLQLDEGFGAPRADYGGLGTGAPSLANGFRGY